MDLINVKIESKAKDIAEVKPGVIIRCNSSFRYLFIPYLLDNKNDNSKCLKAQLVVQKKNPSELWKNFDTLALNKLKTEEWFKVDISSDELEKIISYCLELRDLYKEEGKKDIFNSKRVTILNNSINPENARAIINTIKENPVTSKLLDEIIEHDLDIDDIQMYLANKKNNISTITDKLNEPIASELYDSLKLRFIKTSHLRDNMSNSKEEFWQTLFSRNPNILFSVIPSVLQLVSSKPYVGGKSIENRGGSISDFIFKCGVKNTSLIEIKTPTCFLMNNNEYRKNVYAPHSDLVGAIVQVHKQKDELIKNYYSLNYNSSDKFEAFDPKCYLIIGNASQLTNEQSESFELFRNELKDIEIITYDELIFKLDLLLESLI